jgi:pyridoxal phosphate enzyme (YggS family)
MIRANLDAVRERIRRRCEAAGRSPDEVTLVAVAKTFPPEAVREAVRCGLRDIGENYVQELAGKRQLLAGEDIRWHFVGHLQRNKVKAIGPWIHLIHAVDSAGLAREIDRRARDAGRVVELLVEVNTTEERSKFGIPPQNAESFVRELNGLENVCIAGLMTMGPFLPDPEGSRPMFRRLRELRDTISQREQHNVALRHLSMGMTGDFEVAIDEGATMLRIGTAIFGARRHPV